MPLGATYADLVLNAIFRGSFGSPATTLYWTLGDQVNLPTTVGNRTMPYGYFDPPTEWSGIVRVPHPINRGAWSSSNPSGLDYFASERADSADDYRRFLPVTIWCPSVGTDKIPGTFMLYDASTNGNLVAYGDLAVWTTAAKVNSEDVLRLQDRSASDGYTEDLTTTRARTRCFRRCWTSPRCHELIIDWLFRGFSLSSRYDTTNYTSIRLQLGSLSDSINSNFTPAGNQTALTVTRATGSWSAPATPSGHTGQLRFIENSNTLNFPAASGNYTFNAVAAYLYSSAQAYADMITVVAINDTLSTTSVSTGDVVSFPAGDLEIVLG
jgi:hypothetical protein